MLYVTGDCHGDVIEKFSKYRYLYPARFQEDDYVVILGDWGVVWNDEYKKDTICKLEWMAEKPWTWVCLLGNHDNWDWALSLPKANTEIGPVRECVYNGMVYENIYIVADPAVLDICGEKCFCIPGAECHDGSGLFIDPQGNEHSDLLIYHPNKNYFSLMNEYENAYTKTVNQKYIDFWEEPSFYRTLGENYWADEAIDVDSAGEILHYLSDNDCHLDFVFSHDAPAIQLKNINIKLPSSYKEPITEGELFLEKVRKELDFDCWFHGHLHWDRLQPKEDDRVVCLFGTLLNLSLGEVIQ